jgi:hypothetical protein
VVVEAPPAASFEVIDADLLLQLLIVPFDSPSDLRQTNELIRSGIVRHRG